MHKLATLTALLFITLSAQAQPYGNAARAKKAAQRTDAAMASPEVRLGYLESATPTRQEFLDNLEVGLLPAGSPSSNIISYTLRIYRKGTEYQTTDVIQGHKIPRDIYNKYSLSTLTTGDRITFENIRLEDTRKAYRYMPPINLTVL